MTATQDPSASARTDQAIRNHLASASELLASALEDLRGTDPAAVDGLAQALLGGAMLRSTVTVARSGLAVVAVEVVTPAGEVMSLMTIELQRELDA